LAASASVDGSIILWDVETGEAIRRYPWRDGGSVWSVAFSPDGQYILAGGDESQVSLWRVDSSLDDLIVWITANRFVPEPTCIQRELYNLPPLCIPDVGS
jgi:WD40 repeat protein